MGKDNISVSVIGLGKLGIPIAACYASKGYTTIGVDVTQRTIDLLNHGQSPIYEPHLQEKLDESGGRLTATMDTQDAVRRTDMSFVVVPTPSEAEGGFSLKYILDACREIGTALRDKNSRHVVVITSTVMPGSTDGPIRETLEHHSGKRCGVDFGLCYSPEFIALGSVVHDLLFPDFLLVGVSDEETGDQVTAFYSSVVESNPPFARMNNVNAELAKLSVNTYVTTKITFANMLARICERLPGADSDVVTWALGLDSRIGRKYLKGSIAYGGPCFPRDNKALAHLARQLDVPATIAVATDESNHNETALLVNRVLAILPPDGKVGILGLAYKPSTDVVTESPGVALAQALLDQGITVYGFDPAAGANAQRALGDRLHIAESIDHCVELSDVIVVTVPDPIYRTISPAAIAREGTPRVVVDCWRLLDPKDLGGADYFALGRYEPAAKVKL